MAELRGEEARHLTRVLRAEAGQRYEISDGKAAYLAEIAEARGPRVVFRVIEPLDTPATPLHITLCAALIKFDRFEWIVEKATELGVERILPVEAERSGKGLLEASRKRAERWARIARESSQQSRRVRAPEILPAVRFERSLAEEADYRYFLEEAAAPPLLRVLPASRVSRQPRRPAHRPRGRLDRCRAAACRRRGLAAGFARSAGAARGNGRHGGHRGARQRLDRDKPLQ